jgi:hypothetical protein
MYALMILKSVLEAAAIGAAIGVAIVLMLAWASPDPVYSRTGGVLPITGPAR